MHALAELLRRLLRDANERELVADHGGVQNLLGVDTVSHETLLRLLDGRPSAG